MEKVSKKRGRPRTISDGPEISRMSTDHYGTARSLHNAAYRQRALFMLAGEDSDDAPFSHFLPSANDVLFKNKKFSMTLLSEIGRLPIDEMRSVAGMVCELKLSTKEAIKFVRQQRIGALKKRFNQIELLQRLAAVIDGYCESHCCTFQQLHTTIESLKGLVATEADAAP